ncbi:MAG: rhodanese-like domain-containing protein [Sphingomonadales bacterium]|nr:rhodanese-like domain-containing protein [Sphingomonadales bacterium]MDE2569284.1 rhodanese-like domain-containing protein [Sphingomonadales bacterium]
MFGFGKSKAIRELTPQELAGMLDRGEAIVVDVREPGEFAAARIRGSVNMPLSRFGAQALPDGRGRQVILTCAAGRRSALALAQCARAGVEVDTHLGGGMGAWMRAGLPVER